MPSSSQESQASFERLEQIVGDRGSVSIQRNPPTRHQTLPWACSFENNDWVGYGTGTTLVEAVEDALLDYDQSIEVRTEAASDV
jgi:hypothetical protein